MASVMKLEFQEVRILTALTRKTMALIPNTGENYRGIGLVEVIWKVCVSITNNRLRAAITLHGKLHDFRQGRGTVTATMEAKLAQKLAGLYHGPPFQVLLDVRKAYDSLDRGRCMEILRGYGLGPNLKRLLLLYWDE